MTINNEFITIVMGKYIFLKTYNNSEEYVSLQVDEILTENGFDFSELLEGNTLPSIYDVHYWLIKKKNIFVEVSYLYGDYFVYDIFRIPTHDLIGLSDRIGNRYSSYIEALKKGIEEAIKLI